MTIKAYFGGLNDNTKTVTIDSEKVTFAQIIKNIKRLADAGVTHIHITDDDFGITVENIQGNSLRWYGTVHRSRD